LALVGCGVPSYLLSEHLAIRYFQSRAFNSVLGPQEAAHFRGCADTLLYLDLLLVLTPKNEPSLEQSINSLGALRSKAPADVIPLIDLQIARDNAIIARLAQTSNNPADSLAHNQQAATLLKSIGWQDVSEPVLANIAGQQLKHWGFTK
jgi:hypothetical protein